MATKAYIGVNGVARKIKKMYIGINGIARKIKKAYIGVNGVARLFFTSSTLIKLANAPTLSYSATKLGAASNNSYGMFAGGTTSSSSYTEYGSAYNTNLVKSSIQLKYSASEPACSSGKLCGVFYGGVRNSTYSSACSAFGETLVRTDKNLKDSNGLAHSAGAFVDIYHLFCGGWGLNSAGNNDEAKNIVYSFNESALTYSSSLTVLPEALRDMAGASTKNHAMFAGGRTTSSTAASLSRSAVYSYNSSTTRTTLSSMSLARHAMVGCGNDKYAFFIGGNSGGYVSNIDIYNDSNVKITSTLSLPSTINSFSASGLNDYILIAGGKSGTTTTGLVNTYLIDTSNLVMSSFTSLTTKRFSHNSTVISDKILIGGGTTSSSTRTNTVEVYGMGEE